MFCFEIDKKSLEEKINKLSSWDEWNSIETKIFRSEEWPEKNLDLLEKEAAELPLNIDGYEWKVVVDSYDIVPEILHLYEKTRWEVFAILEPEADKENKSHPEWYGKWCVYCKRWTREYPEPNCPQCDNELLPLPLNED